MKKTLLFALTISVTGLVAPAAEGERKPEARRSSILEKYDKNKNGKLDQEERDALRKDREAERVKRYDKNGDGKLDEQEEQAARNEVRKRRGENAPAKKETPPAK